MLFIVKMKHHGVIFCTVSLPDGKHDPALIKDVIGSIKHACTQKQFTVQFAPPQSPPKSCFATSSSSHAFRFYKHHQQT